MHLDKSVSINLKAIKLNYKGSSAIKKLLINYFKFILKRFLKRNCKLFIGN